ncbi:hypothetical protein A2U01_0061612, partial [Trifolium medium]|nr:hypothetical protein [Trifolium medium]
IAIAPPSTMIRPTDNNFCFLDADLRLDTPPLSCEYVDLLPHHLRCGRGDWIGEGDLPSTTTPSQVDDRWRVDAERWWFGGQ